MQKKKLQSEYLECKFSYLIYLLKNKVVIKFFKNFMPT